MKITQEIKRKAIQVAAFGLTNCHITNFVGEKGAKIYTGPWKQFCNPGLNCYSCPAASVSYDVFHCAFAVICPTEGGAESECEHCYR